MDCAPYLRNGNGAAANQEVFQAIVIACSIADLTQCVEFHNARHPLKTREACEERAMQMANDINRITFDLKAIQWRCFQLKKGALT